MTRILVVDNYDSFVYTQVSYLLELGAEVDVVRNDAVEVSAVDGYDGVLLSPGPGHPRDAGICVCAVTRCAQRRIPLLGVCLGHQAIGQAFGAVVNHAPELMHGKSSLVVHDGHGVLSGLPQPFSGTRYHSLAIPEDSLPAELAVTGRTPGGVVMAIEHDALPVFGVQFHPESVLTEGGHLLLANWLAVCGDDEAVTRAHGLAPLVAADAGLPTPIG